MSNPKKKKLLTLNGIKTVPRYDHEMYIDNGGNIKIGENISIAIEIKGLNRIRFFCDAPKYIKILRQEII